MYIFTWGDHNFYIPYLLCPDLINSLVVIIYGKRRAQEVRNRF